MDSDEVQAAKAFKTLAAILVQEREKKRREKEEEDAKAKAIEMDIFSAEVKTRSPIDKEALKDWVLYPERSYRSIWDLFMTV